MAGYTADQLGIKAPDGGFKDNGWYQGRNYDAATGTFGNPGQNWSKNNPSSGTMVSSAVNAQSSVAQGKAPNSIQSYLDSFQSSVQANIAGTDTQNTNGTDAVASAVNDQPPAPPNLTNEYETLTGQYGVNDLMKQLNDLNAQKRQLQQSVITGQQKTETQPEVTADVVSGRESEQQREAGWQIDSLNLQIDAVSQQLNTANSIVSTIMQLQSQDYQNASQYYETQFNNAMAFQKMIIGEQEFQQNYGLQEQSLQIQQESLGVQETRLNQQIAASNLTTITNALLSGNLSYGDLPSSTRSQIPALEAQAGLPQGTIESIHSSGAMSKVLGSNSATGQVFGQDEMGNFITYQTSPQPTKIDGYDYLYNPSTQSYNLMSGQGWFGSNFGIFAPKNIPAMTGSSNTSTVSNNAADSLFLNSVQDSGSAQLNP